jgi:hypothetical protein
MLLIIRNFHIIIFGNYVNMARILLDLQALISNGFSGPFQCIISGPACGLIFGFNFQIINFSLQIQHSR